MGDAINHARATRELDVVASQQAREIQEVLANATPNFSIEDVPEEAQKSDLYDSIIARGQMQVATGFTGDEVKAFHQLIRPFCVTERQVGARPKSSFLDMLVCYLSWAKLGLDYLKLSVVLGGISASRLEDNIGRIRPIMKKTLFQKWFDSPARPRPLSESPFPHVALLVDAHTTPCYRPKAPFDEAKIYYDYKNHTYGLKTEVAVSAQPPHFCTHISNHVPASVHDFELFKSGYERYLPYLLKLPNEQLALPGDQASRHWALLSDKGYIGPVASSPDVRRICPIKNPQTHQDRAYNVTHSHFRVYVECFFGRLLGLFQIFRGVYRWSHKHFDDDFIICCALTNEVITVMSLQESDLKLYTSLQEKRVRDYEESKRKRKQEQDAYRDRRRRRLSLG